jgi:glycerophosphoryl diester phosphodiesterase
MRSNAFGGKMILNDVFVEQGRTPWSYRPCGSMIVLPERQMPYPRICAHRGFKTAAPENTLPAFGAAIALGAEEIELDVRFTRDGVPVVCHDDRLDRVSNGTGLVQELTFDRIRGLDAGVKFSPHFEGTKIPSFEEVLAKFARHAIINLHIKSTGETYPKEQFRQIVDLLKKYDQMEHVYLMASGEVMQTALEVAPEIPRCMSADILGKPLKETAWEIVDRAVEWRCSKVQLFKPYFNRELIEKAHSFGIRCNVFWSDDPKEAAEFFDLGVDTILTNDYLAISRVKDSL